MTLPAKSDYGPIVLRKVALNISPLFPHKQPSSASACADTHLRSSTTESLLGDEVEAGPFRGPVVRPPVAACGEAPLPLFRSPLDYLKRFFSLPFFSLAVPFV